jgi:hypothetical protein
VPSVCQRSGNGQAARVSKTRTADDTHIVAVLTETSRVESILIHCGELGEPTLIAREGEWKVCEDCLEPIPD